MTHKNRTGDATINQKRKRSTEQIFNQIPKTNEECTPSAGKSQDRYALGTTWEKDDEFYKYSQKRDGR